MGPFWPGALTLRIQSNIWKTNRLRTDSLGTRIASLPLDSMAPRKDRTDTVDVLAPTGVIAPVPIEVESPVFTGSLGMLFACVRERKIDLADVPLFPICAAYYTYLATSDPIDLDQAAAGLTALAYLIERKSWLLLPTPEPEPEEDTQATLPEPTLYEYEGVIQVLSIGMEERSRRFFRPIECGPNPYELPYDLGEVTVSDLAVALESIMQRACPDPLEVAPKPMRSLSDQMRILLGVLDAKWRPLGGLLPERYTRRDVVWCFLALLELIRLGQAKLRLADSTVEFQRGRSMQSAA